MLQLFDVFWVKYALLDRGAGVTRFSTSVFFYCRRDPPFSPDMHSDIFVYLQIRVRFSMYSMYVQYVTQLNNLMLDETDFKRVIRLRFL